MRPVAGCVKHEGQLPHYIFIRKSKPQTPNSQKQTTNNYKQGAGNFLSGQRLCMKSICIVYPQPDDCFMQRTGYPETRTHRFPAAPVNIPLHYVLTDQQFYY